MVGGVFFFQGVLSWVIVIDVLFVMQGLAIAV